MVATANTQSGISQMDADNGLVYAVLLDGTGGGTQLDWSGIKAWAPERGTLWVHLDFSKDPARQWLSDASGIDPLISEALMADETRPRCAAVADGLLLSLRGVNNNPGADPEDMVSIRLFSTAQRIISTRRRRLLSVRDMIEALNRGEGPRTSGELTAMLADRLIERMSVVINDLEESTGELEERIIEETGQPIRMGILALRREIIQLRRYLAPQREALNRLHADKAPWLSEHDRMQLRETSDKITRHVEDLDSAKDHAAVAYEELAGRTAEQMNARMYVLSIIAGLFLPLGFLTGLLGINVGGIPLADNPWGFIEVLVFLLILLAVQIGVFRYKGWF